MKKYIFLTIILFANIGKSQTQKFSVGFGGGSGKNYIEEDVGSSSIQYGSPVGLYLDLYYRNRPTSSWVWVLRMQYINSIRKEIYQNNDGYVLEGDMSSFNYFLLLQKQYIINKKWQVGFNFGVGKTAEYYRQDIIHGGVNQNYWEPKRNDFLSIMVGGTVIWSLTDYLGIQLQPCLYWFEPVNSIRGFADNKKFSVGVEDWHALMQLGLVYRIW